MALTHTAARVHSSRHTLSTKRLMAQSSTPLLPEGEVKEMLHDIAFVLHVTRLLSREIQESATCAEAVPC